MSASSQQNVRVRFAPSPTGYLHVGGARTVLFNWLLARQAGGKLVLRIEDTDQNRHVEDSVSKILDDLRWLGMTWDEGPEAGGDFGPYFQSQRLEIYNRYAQKLLEAGKAYYALETPEELAAMREASRTRTGGFRYPRPSPLPTIEQGLAALKAGRPAVVRFMMPGRDIVVRDDILGEVTMPADQLEDFVIVKSDGYPTYHFACVIDDALMEITHVLRGQEHLMNTPRHVALQEAMAFPTPRYAHLPVIFNMDGTKMSKRDKEKALREGRVPPEIEVHDFRASGYLPEALINFLALLGWSAGDDRERYTLEELVEAFRVERIGRTNAKFDREKLLAFNTQWGQTLPAERLGAALRDYAEVNGSPMAEADDALLARIGEACRGFRTLRDVENKVAFLFDADEAIEFDPKAVKKVLEKNEGEGYRVLEALLPELEALGDWSAASVERFMEEVCRKRDVQLGKVAQPVRVAVTGTTISPSIHDTLALLGRERTLKRLRRCIAERQTI